MSPTDTPQYDFLLWMCEETTLARPRSFQIVSDERHLSKILTRGGLDDDDVRAMVMLKLDASKSHGDDLESKIDPLLHISWEGEGH